ncbi:GNAT family N-acetyltransferase [Nonomuraea aridisoli]|uniref:GNAT family N-acetyltransferase n=1 Tax=Nonomuraea aridisoli TaxID=2070368 RepID=A0A2W2EFM2_9ACTN|nr:GNAT family N-acetyltransferase [Nonomuraea aridisoli]PZG21203.1 GNAT family N-acetyltransferase [Nonomuraea aridisoli]
MSVEVEIAREATPDVVAALGRLLPQLSTTAKALDQEAVARLLAFASNTVLVARVRGEIVGTLTLVTFPLPSGLRARVEDVVVDERARGRGVAAALTGRALALAREAGARTVDLTSRPSRHAANRLYERAGFRRRDSVVYRFVLDGHGPAT